MKLSEELCEFSDLKKSECAHCLGQTDKPEKPVLDQVVVAKHWGRCWECGEGIEPGDHIGASEVVTDHAGNVIKKLWAHYACGA